MSSFGLLDKVRGITTQSTKTTTQYPVYNKSFESAAKDSTINGTFVESLAPGMGIIDSQGVIRFVIAIDYSADKVILTGKNASHNNYKKVFVWSFENLEKATYTRGFRIL